MTEAEEAYELAARLIAEADARGATRLDLSQPGTRALERLPDSIADLEMLEDLDCDGTQIRDLTPIAGLNTLRELQLRGTQVVDLKPLSGLENLKGLRLKNTPVVDLAPLSGLTSLIALTLDGTRVRDLRPLSSLTFLTLLYLGRTEVTDVSPLSGLTNLDGLALDGTKVTDIGPLSGLVLLDALWLNNTDVRDLRPTRKMPLLVTAPAAGGLNLMDCAATRNDLRIREISEVKDDSERARTLFDYLKDWTPKAAGDALPPQALDGFEHSLVGGRIGFAPGGEDAATDAAELFDLLREDLDALLDACPSGDNAPFKAFRKLLQAYGNALGTALPDLAAPRLWNAGNKLRLELKADENRSDLTLDGAPKLNEELQTGLDALVALHNVFAGAHPRLAALDANRPDPVDRPDAAAARAQMEELVEAIAPQVRVIMEEVIEEYQTLHRTSAGDDDFAARALAVERDSLNNLITFAVREALREERQPSALKVTLSDVRAASVGGAVTGAAPYVVGSLPHLVTVLAPQMGALMSAMHAQDYPVQQTLAWIVNKVRDRARRYDANEEDKDAPRA